MKQQTKWGTLTIDPQVFGEISARAALGCFGVKGLAGGPLTDSAAEMLGKARLKKGVHLRFDEQETLFVELHIIVESGVNIAVLCKNIISQVTYQVNRQTGVQVGSVNVFVDGVANA